MAYTVSIVDKSVFGNKRVVAISATADAASGVIVTGLSVVDAVAMAPTSMATAGVKVKRNLNASSAAALGSIMVSSAASGDDIFLIVYGR